VDRSLEFAFVDLRQLSTDLLVRYKFKLFADRLAPALDASAAKSALAVIDHQRALGRRNILRLTHTGSLAKES
jgi:hypothetical protein